MICCHKLSGSSLHELKQKEIKFQCSYGNKGRNEKSPDCDLLLLTCIQVEKRFEYRYNLQRSVMLFHEAEIFSFSKNITSIGPFPDPLFYYTVLYVKEESLIMGEVPGGKESKVREERQMRLIKWNSIFM